MSENLNEPTADELPRLRDQCGALALELERETDPTRRAELARELAEIEKPWQGGPPAIKSSSPRFKPNSFRTLRASTLRMSRLSTCVAGWLAA